MHYKNSDSATATYRALRGDYGFHTRPTTQVIGKIVKKFEEIDHRFMYKINFHNISSVRS